MKKEQLLTYLGCSVALTGPSLARGRGFLHQVEPLVVCVLFLHGVGSSAQRCNKFKKN